MMRPLFPLLLLGLLRPFTAGCPMALTQQCEPTDGDIYRYHANTLNDRRTVNFSDYRGKKLNALHEEMKPLGLTILGFPCNQFGNQEPGQNHEILPGLIPGNGFVPNFLLFEKGDVNGKDEQEVFTFLRLFWGPMKLSDIKWNFEKFLVGPNGKPVMRWHPSISIPQVRADIRKYLLLQLYTHSRG
ncbi:hypothetical protein F7725_009892 [Dissostichus mawsoni]|uniref:Glutathione peroxidase n=1 Tax=Dissostichus mawsoni TaxID=36200 RepID=A0A7J5XM27_DISMA|nr:hypothetical protein F7725_009892 [Dissostichus mawsoni]